MKPSTFTKTVTLSCFVFLVIIFLLYRTGKVDLLLEHTSLSLQQSPNGGTANSGQADTVTPVKPDSLIGIRIDAKKLSQDKGKKKSDSLIPQIIFSGSKSGKIFSPVDFKPVTTAKKSKSN